MSNYRKRWLHWRRRLCQIVEVGSADDFVSRAYDFLSTFVLLANVAVTVL